MADQNITALPVSTAPASSDQLLLVGTAEEKLIDYDKLADAILNKLTSKNFSLDQGTMTLMSALNQLNSKVLPDIYKNYSWKTSHSINVSGANILVMFAFGGATSGQSVILPMVKTGVDNWSYREKFLESTAYTISCKDNVMTITNTQEILCILIKLS